MLDNVKNRKLAKAIGIIALFFSLLTFFAKIIFMDKIILSFGIRTYFFLEKVALINFIVFVSCLVFICVSLVVEQRNEKARLEAELQEQEDPLHEEEEVISELKDIADKVGKPEYRYYAEKAVEQMENAKKFSLDFVEISNDHNLPIVKSIEKELIAIRVQLIKDGKSICRRLSLTDNAGSISEKIEKNDKRVKDARKLIEEAINYIDSKTSGEEVDLNNLIEALKDLVTMM